MTVREFWGAMLGVTLLYAASGAIAFGVVNALAWQSCGPK